MVFVMQIFMEQVLRNGFMNLKFPVDRTRQTEYLRVFRQSLLKYTVSSLTEINSWY